MENKKNRNIGILTYNSKHRKTYDTLCMLMSNGYKKVSIYALPLSYKKRYAPIYEHRPPVTDFIPDTRIICENFGYSYYEEDCIDDFNISKEDILLVCGAGILPNDFIESHKIINAHPGYIPNCRGLDAYKWAIYEEQPIGVTTHLIGNYVDAGEIIERKIIPIHKNDTFHSVAQRVYENEIGMLVKAIEMVDEIHTMILPREEYAVHKRMPYDCEKQIMEKFQSRIDDLK